MVVKLLNIWLFQSLQIKSIFIGLLLRKQSNRLISERYACVQAGTKLKRCYQYLDSLQKMSSWISWI